MNNVAKAIAAREAKRVAPKATPKKSTPKPKSDG